ncbi:MAG: NAD(P)/FAD-dependent oxidoreductase [Bacteroidales bacterium]|nr:NAD(P)/FAD-dependent oxidoreductase [Bacteroidales bacterium]
MKRRESPTRVIVAGAGPAGSVCAYLLMQSDVDVTLLDKAEFPRDKICGGGLTHKAYELLEEIYPGWRYEYNGVRHIHVTVNGHASCEFDAEKEIRIVKRKVFDHELLKKYLEAGGRFVNEGLRSFEEKEDGTVVVTLSNGEQLEGDYLVGADGTNSRVRNLLSPKPSKKMLILEQYMDRDPKNQIVIRLARRTGGYYYRFPNSEFDTVGYCDYDTTPEKFRALLSRLGLQETKLRGAYVPMSNDYPLHDHVILIGDAGGFSNRLTFEGLFYAIMTARNAHEAIVTQHSFSEVNRLFFRKKKKEERAARVFYSRLGMWFCGFCCRWPRLVKSVFDKLS